MFGYDKLESLKEEFFEDRSMAFSCADEWQELERAFEQLSEEGCEDITLKDLKRRADES